MRACNGLHENKDRITRAVKREFFEVSGIGAVSLVNEVVSGSTNRAGPIRMVAGPFCDGRFTVLPVELRLLSIS